MAVSVFIDVSSSSPLQPYIEALWNNGITSGTGGSIPYVDLTYSPANNITNQEIGTFVVRALKVTIDPTVLPDAALPEMFSDLVSSAGYFPYVQKLMKLGAMCGPSREAATPDYGPGLFLAATAIKRKQIAECIQSSIHWDLVNPSAASFSDVPTTHPYFKQVETVYQHSVMSGTAGLFDPDGLMARDVAAKLICDAYQIPVVP